MTDIAIVTTLNGVPVNGLANDPEISFRRLDTGAAVGIVDIMVDTGGAGIYSYEFVNPLAGVPYAFSIEADPTATGQTDTNVYSGAFDTEVTDIWRDRGLDPNDPKTVDDNGVADDADIDEDVAAGAGPVIHKDVITVGTVTTVTRA